MKTKEELDALIEKHIETDRTDYLGTDHIGNVLARDSKRRSFRAGYEAGVEARGGIVLSKKRIQEIIHECVEKASYRSYDERGDSLDCIDARDLDDAIKEMLSNLDKSGKDKP